MDQKHIEQAMEALQAQKAVLGQAVLDTALAALQNELSARPSLPIQQKEISALCANMSGLTGMIEMMAQDAAYQTLNTLWRRIDAVIMAHGGRLEKHYGNTLLALFGVDTNRENEPEWAIRAGLAMQAELRAFIREQADVEGTLNGAPHLHLRIGITTGLALLGPIGLGAEYSAQGEVVTLAGRLEYSAPEGSILISHKTYQHVRGVFYVQPAEPILFKDIAAPVPVYVVRGAKPRAIRVISRGVEGIETRMVGRDAELAQLKQAFYHVMGEGRVHAVTIVGEAGWGKSRLLYEFDQWLELLPINMTFFQGRASRETSQLPCWVIRDLFSFYFDVQASDKADSTHKKLIQGISEIVGDHGAEMATSIGRLIGFDPERDYRLQSPQEEPRQLYQRAVDSIVQFFAATTTNGCPVVIVLEDIHWADDGSLNIIDYLARYDKNFPMLIVCPTQPSLYERHPQWNQNWPNHTRIELAPLSKEDSSRLIGEIFRKSPQVPATLQSMLIERPAGNPLFIEELVKLLVESEVVLTTPNRWQIDAERLAQIQIPPSLAEILRNRVLGLPVLERETLQKAAVIGRAFWNHALAGMGENGPDEINVNIIDLVLESLQEKELILKREASAFANQDEYVFKHTLFKEITYETVPPSLRRTYHAQVARWLTENNGEQVDAYAALIAGHYEAAQQPNLAAEWFNRAGKTARQSNILPVAFTHYQKALELWAGIKDLSPKQVTQKIETYQGVVTVLLQLAEQEHHPEMISVVPAEMALAYAQQGLAFAKKTEHPQLIASSWRLQGQAAALALAQKPPTLGAGATDPVTCFTKSMEILTRIGNRYQQALTLQAWADFELAQGNKFAGESMRQEAEGILIDLDL